MLTKNSSKDSNKQIWTLKKTLVIITLFLTFCINLNFNTDNDIWWHLKAGEYIVKNKIVPETDIFSYTAVGHTWMNHEWLAQVIFYLLYTIGGLKALILAKATIVTLTFYIFYLLTKKTPYLSVASIIFLSFFTDYYSLVRPHIFQNLFLLISIYLFVEEKYIYLPLIFLFWANIHSSVFIGLLVLGILLGFKLLKNIQKKDFTKQKKIVIYGLLTLSATIINPYRYKLMTYVGNVKQYSELIKEWQPFPTTTIYFIIFLILCIITCLTFFIQEKKRLSIPIMIIFILFCYLGFSARRFVSISSLVLTWILCTNISAALNKETKSKFIEGLERILSESKIKNIIIIFFVLILFYPAIKHFDAINFSEKTKDYPEEAIDFIRNNNISGNIYHDYAYGGPVIWELWPQQKVFIDGRITEYEPEIVRDYYSIHFAEDIQQMIEKYDIEYFLISHQERLELKLYKDSHWKLVHIDDEASVYVRNIEKYKNLHAWTLEIA